MKSAYQLILHIEQNYTDQVAFRYYDDTQKRVISITYSRYTQDIRRCVTWLHNTMPEVADRHIGLLAGNSYNYAVLMMAIFVSDAVAVPLNTATSAEELEYELKLAEVDALFYDSAALRRMSESIRSHVDVLHPMDAYMTETELSELHECKDVDALSLILFTSGTTGRSKGVMFSQSRMYADLDFYSTTIRLGDNGAASLLWLFPLFHVGGVSILTLFTFMGLTLAINSSMKYLYRDLEELECDYLVISPMIAELIVKDFKRGREHRWRRIRAMVFASAAIPGETMTFFREHNIFVVNAYGQTESCGDITVNWSGDPQKDASVGKPGPLRQIRIEDGEICLQSKTNMMGYYHDDVSTNEVLRDGWLHTGDLGYLDSDGYLYITGRKKNLMVMPGGENVSPEELERLLARCDAIREVLVYQEESHISATIYCNQSDQHTISDYIDDVNRGLPLFKRITRIHYTEQELPKTATNKIKRF